MAKWFVKFELKGTWKEVVVAN